MTRDDIIRMAREAGWGPFTAELHAKHLTTFFERAYKAGAAAEADRIANEARGAAADREDAARYRWLRDNNASFSWNPSRYNQETISGFAAFGTGYCGFEFEAAVDKARSKQ